jgi:hypothetical protein
MRYPGDNAAGRRPGRRLSPSGRMSPPEEGAAGADGKPPRGDASLFTPGYSAGGQARDQDPFLAGGGWYGPGGAAGKGPIRGFPPAPGQPPPLYPPGQFSAWNRASAQGDNGYDPNASDTWLALDYAGSAGDDYPEPGAGDQGYGDPGPEQADAGFGETAYAGYRAPDLAEPGYAALAVSEPAADVTSTQAWETVDSAPPASHWPDPDTTAERWPGASEGQHTRLPGATLAAGRAGPGLGGPGLGGPGLDGPGLGGPGLDGPGLSGPDEDHPGGWDDPRWPAVGEPTPLRRAGDTDPGLPDHDATGPGQRAATGPGQRAATGPGQRITTGSGQYPAGPGADPGRLPRGRGRGTRGRTRPRGRKRRARALLACALALAVVAGATYFWFVRNHKSPDAAGASQQTAASARPSPTDPAPSPSPSLGPWGHIGSRALDSVPLTLAELFPAQFTSAGANYARTVDKAKTHCAAALMGSQLVTAVGQAGCTQAMCASYLSADHKLMGTIGVLNLATTAAAEKAGKASGPSDFIAQLPAATGPTRNLTKGNGFEAAEVKGHYLVLVWAEFANLRAPRTAAQKTELESFINLLFQQTANVSLASREVTGTPAS